MADKQGNQAIQILDEIQSDINDLFCKLEKVEKRVEIFRKLQIDTESERLMYEYDTVEHDLKIFKDYLEEVMHTLENKIHNSEKGKD